VSATVGRPVGSGRGESSGAESLNVVALAGGVGGAKLVHGLVLAGEPERLTAIVNTADDFTLYGLHISPDLDTVLYTLAGIANPATGWGIAGDTYQTLAAIEHYGREPWFRLGDRDFATHILRTERLGAGTSLTAVMHELATALGVRSTLLPMTDDPVATLVDSPSGRLAFQDYFVARGQTDQVDGVVFDGVEESRLPSAVEAAIVGADLIVICPSNPIVSVGPILAVPGMRATLTAAPPLVAVSPIVGGRALKGPADRMLATLGHEVSAYGVAALYGSLIDGMVIDEADAALTPRIEALGMAVLVTGTIMGNDADRRRLAAETVAFARTLRPAPAPATDRGVTQ